MKELFIVEGNDRKLRIPVIVALLAALAFLFVFAGCAPAGQADGSRPAVTSAAAEPPG